MTKSKVTMSLIKDFDTNFGKVIYYFEQDGEQLSPDMTTFPQLAEWWLLYHTLENPYGGNDRRQSHLDRRGARGKDIFERALSGSETTSFGRRRTDIHIRVAEDRSTEKIAALRRAFTQLDTLEQETN